MVLGYNLQIPELYCKLLMQITHERVSETMRNGQTNDSLCATNT